MQADMWRAAVFHAGPQDDLVVVAWPRLPSPPKPPSHVACRPYANHFRSFKWAVGITQYVSQVHRIGEAAITRVVGISFIAHRLGLAG